MFLRFVFLSYYPALIWLVVNWTNFFKSGLFYLWRWLVSNLSLPLSWPTSLLFYFLSSVQLRRGVTEWLWWASGVQPGSTHHRRAKFPFCSFHLVHLGPNFHFHTYKALTGEEVACLDVCSSCWHDPPLGVPPFVAWTAQLLLKRVLNVTHNSTTIWDYLVLSEGKSEEVQQLLHKAKTMGTVWKAGQLGIIIAASCPSCQDTSLIICCAVTV